MNKILLVLKREYLVRVRKPSFIWMTILTPLLFAGLIMLPVLLATSFENEKKIEVIDLSKQIAQNLKSQNKLTFIPSKHDRLDKAKAELEKSEFYAILYIPAINLDKPEGITLIGKKSISLELELEIRGGIEQVIEGIKLNKTGIDKKVLESLKTKVDIQPETLKGEESSSGAAFILGFMIAFIIYMAVLLYSQQVMRGVVEEKTSRIIEVIISSVKPFQLMMGKILGVAAIGMTQFVLWIVLTFAIVTGVTTIFGLQSPSQKSAAIEQLQENTPEKSEADKEQEQQVIQRVFSEFSNVPIVLIISTFLFYFLGGYLLYSAMFAAVASAVDSETDTQQFVLPVSMPLIIAFIAFQAVIRDPDGSVAFWMSIIPFTSPIIMMVRIPFGGVEAWELILSMVLLILGFIGTTWVAARIYRVGILMYGKKVSFKELGKWIFYKM